MSKLEQVWRERIEWQQQSGITVAECCEAEGVSAASILSMEEAADGAAAYCGGSATTTEAANCDSSQQSFHRFFGFFCNDRTSFVGIPINGPAIVRKVSRIDKAIDREWPREESL